MSDGDDEFVVNKSVMGAWFKLPYARTCYSYQGMTEDEPITIFGINEFLVDIQWLYTAITRTTRLDNLYIYVGKTVEDDIKGKCNNMVDSHRRADIDAGRAIIGEYITASWINSNLRKTRTCKFCRVGLDFDNFSVDRIDNDVCHRQDNCQLICSHCNVSKK